MENKRVIENLAKEFMATAKADLKSAELELKGGIYNNAVYHAQQAAEKAVKALLVLNNLFVESHFVADRLKRLVKDEKLVDYVRSLEKNWIITRYPFVRKTEVWSPVKAFTKLDAQDALKKARFVVSQIEKLLKTKYGVKP